MTTAAPYSGDWFAQIAVNKLYGKVPGKPPVRTVAVSNVTRSGLQTISGVVLQEGDHILLTDQNHSYNDLVWVVSAGAWAIRTDMQMGGLKGSTISVLEGDYAGSIWALTNSTEPVLGVDALIWTNQQADSTSGAHAPVAAVATSNLSLSATHSAYNGVSATTGMRIGLVNQTDKSENGIYVHGSDNKLTRATDANASAQFQTGMTFKAAGGATYGGQTFVLATTATIVLDTTDLVFLLQSTSYDVRLWGAQPNASTFDSATAFQAALNALATLGAGELLAPAGVYYVASTVTVPSGITIRGDGQTVSMIREHSSLGAHSVLYIGQPETTITPYGSSPPTVGLTGTVSEAMPKIIISISTAGARGTAKFDWSKDGGTSWTRGVTTAATAALGSTGLTATFAVGTYSTDNSYENYVHDVTLSQLGIRNGTATTGAGTSGQDGVQQYNTHRVRYEHCLITEVAGLFGVRHKYAKDTKARHCRFYRCTYAMLFGSVETDVFKVLDCEFDTLTTTADANSYTVATGYDTVGEGYFTARNVWVQRCTFTGNPRWEGIDCHGADNLWITDNVVEDCKLGISVGLVAGTLASGIESMSNVHIERNSVTKGAGAANGSGIIVTGDVYQRARNVHIESNSVSGFGDDVGSLAGGITVYLAEHVEIVKNDVDQYYQAAILLYNTVWDCNIESNTILDAANLVTDTAAIYLRSVGLFGVHIDKNVVSPSSPAVAPKLWVANASAAVSVQMGTKNSIKYLASGGALYSGVSNLPVEATTRPTSGLTQRYGDVVNDDTGRARYNVSSVAGDKAGYGSHDTASVIVTATINASSKVATITASAGSWSWLPIGMNVSIAGAGVAAAALHARVVENDGTTITLDTAASTSVVGHDLTYQGLVIDDADKFTTSGTTHFYVLQALDAAATKLSIQAGDDGQTIELAANGAGNNIDLTTSGAGGVVRIFPKADFSVTVDGSPRIEANTSGVGVNGGTPGKPTISGSRGGNAALASLLTSLATLGYIVDSTS